MCSSSNPFCCLNRIVVLTVNLHNSPFAQGMPVLCISKTEPNKYPQVSIRSP